MAAKIKMLQLWCRRQCEGYRDVDVTNMTSSWKSGLAFCAILHRYRPDLIDYDSLSKENVYDNNKLAFDTGHNELDIPALLDAEDMVSMTVPDKLCIVTYVAQYYNTFRDKEAVGGPGVKECRVAAKRTSSTQPPAPAPEPKKGTSTKPFQSEQIESNILQSNKTSQNGKQVTQTAKRGTFGDTCHICKKKVYLMERHIDNQKLYHRGCIREQQRSLTRNVQPPTSRFNSGETSNKPSSQHPAPSSRVNKPPEVQSSLLKDSKSDDLKANEQQKSSQSSLLKMLYGASIPYSSPQSNGHQTGHTGASATRPFGKTEPPKTSEQSSSNRNGIGQRAALFDNSPKPVFGAIYKPEKPSTQQSMQNKVTAMDTSSSNGDDNAMKTSILKSLANVRKGAASTTASPTIATTTTTATVNSHVWSPKPASSTVATTTTTATVNSHVRSPKPASSIVATTTTTATVNSHVRSPKPASSTIATTTGTATVNSHVRSPKPASPTVGTTTTTATVNSHVRSPKPALSTVATTTGTATVNSHVRSPKPANPTQTSVFQSPPKPVDNADGKSVVSSILRPKPEKQADKVPVSAPVPTPRHSLGHPLASQKTIPKSRLSDDQEASVPDEQPKPILKPRKSWENSSQSSNNRKSVSPKPILKSISPPTSQTTISTGPPSRSILKPLESQPTDKGPARSMLKSRECEATLEIDTGSSPKSILKSDVQGTRETKGAAVASSKSSNESSEKPAPKVSTQFLNTTTSVSTSGSVQHIQINKPVSWNVVTSVSSADKPKPTASVSKSKFPSNQHGQNTDSKTVLKSNVPNQNKTQDTSQNGAENKRENAAAKKSAAPGKPSWQIEMEARQGIRQKEAKVQRPAPPRPSMPPNSAAASKPGPTATGNGQTEWQKEVEKRQVLRQGKYVDPEFKHVNDLKRKSTGTAGNDVLLKSSNLNTTSAQNKNVMSRHSTGSLLGGNKLIDLKPVQKGGSNGPISPPPRPPPPKPPKVSQETTHNLNNNSTAQNGEAPKIKHHYEEILETGTTSNSTRFSVTDDTRDHDNSYVSPSPPSSATQAPKPRKIAPDMDFVFRSGDFEQDPQGEDPTTPVAPVRHKKLGHLSWVQERLLPAPPGAPKKRIIGAEAWVSPSEMQDEIDNIDEQLRKLESKGREMEDLIRAGTDEDMEEDSLMNQWFETINKKNDLARRECELLYRQRQQELEEVHADLDLEFRMLMSKPDLEKTSSDRIRENSLINELLDTVNQRNSIVDSMEEDRVRYLAEDQEIADKMAKGMDYSEQEKKPEEEKKKKKKKTKWYRVV